jgi:hypothetical protein
MTIINRFSKTKTVATNDFVLIQSTENGDLRLASVLNFAEAIIPLIPATAPALVRTQRIVRVTASSSSQTVLLPATSDDIVLLLDDSSIVIDTLSVSLPNAASCIDGQKVVASYRIFNGSSFYSAPGSALTGTLPGTSFVSFLEFTFFTLENLWYRTA